MRLIIAIIAIISVACVTIPRIYPNDVTVTPTWNRHVSESRGMSVEFGFLDDADFHTKVCRAR